MSPSSSINPAGTPANVLVLRRLIDAPRELVFAVWSDPLHVAEWWRPAGYTTPVFEMDFSVGGNFRYCIYAVADQVPEHGWRRCARNTAPDSDDGYGFHAWLPVCSPAPDARGA